MREEAAPAQDQRPTCWWPSNSVDTFGSVSLDAKDETQRNEVLTDSEVYDSVLCQTASQILWKTGMLSEPIPNGFYSVIPVSTEGLKHSFYACFTLCSMHSQLLNFFCQMLNT